jgi:hypothetical protein
MTETAEQNGKAEIVERVTVPRELMQQILDYLATCPAGGVYPLLRRLDAELSLAPATEPAGGEVLVE